MVARAVAMEEAVTVAAKLAWWVARAAARAAGGGGIAASTSPSDRLSTIFRPPFLLVSHVHVQHHVESSFVCASL